MYMQVTGEAEAWKLVLDLPQMTSNARNAKLARNTPEAAQLLAKVFEIADKYDMPVLLQEWDDFRNAWMSFTYQLTDDAPCPNNPAWWIYLAAKHNRLSLAGSALHALMVKCPKTLGYDGMSMECPHCCKPYYRGYSSAQTGQATCAQPWRQHVAYGKKQQGELWAMVCSMLGG